MDEKKITFAEICPHGGRHEKPGPIARIYGVLAGNPDVKTVQPERREKQVVFAS